MKNLLNTIINWFMQPRYSMDQYITLKNPQSGAEIDNLCHEFMQDKSRF